MDAREAKRRSDRITLIGRWIFAVLSASTIVLTVMKVGTDTNWAFVSDIQWPVRDVHWGDWLQIIGAAAAAFAGSAAISFGFRYVQMKKVLNQLIQDNSTHIGSQDNSTHHHTVNNGAHDELHQVLEQIRRMEQVLAERQADPEHLRQLREFLEYAQNERIIELKAQLAKDAEIFERFRGLMSELASESENAAVQAQSVLLRRR